MAAFLKQISITISLTLCLILRGVPAVSETPHFPSFSPVLKQTAAGDSGDSGLDLRSIGLQTMVVLTEDYHTGFGYGGRLTTSFVGKNSALISEIGFWGATRDTTDIAVLGLQETLAYELKKSERIRGFAGVCLGYFYIYRTDSSYRNSVETSLETKSNSFDLFFTYGIEVALAENRALLLQMKYGITEFSDELHIIAGLNFDPHRLRK